MKAFKPSFANVFFVLAISTILILLSFPAWAEDVQGSEAVEVTAEQIAGAVSDQAAGAVAAEPGAEASGEATEQTSPETDEKVEEGAEASPDAAAGGSAMTMMDSGGGAGAGGGISSAMIPESSIFTGSLTTRIPIIVPPGRGGIAPNLALIYNSSKKNGLAGVGWDLDMGAIQRSTKYGLDCEGNDYVAISNGGSTELVSRANDWGGDYYGAKIEGAFTKYKKNSTDEEGWEVTAKDGTKYFYGTIPDRHSRQPCETGVFKWLLDKVQDTNGNFMDIYYTEPENGQIYLDRIEYTGNVGQTPSNYVQFYSEERGDELLSYASHVQMKTTKRLKTIEVGVIGTGIVRAYTLSYKDEYEPSVLASVTQWGDNVEIDEDGNVTSQPELALPPVILTSQETEDGYDADIQPTPYATGLQNIFAQGDFNGDGRTDFLYGPADDYGRMRYALINKHKICLLNEDGTLQTTLFYPPVYGSRVLAQGDFNDDGKTDMVIGATDKYGRIGSQTLYTLTSNGNGTFASSPFQSAADSYQRVASVGDYNGDGHTDFITAYTDDKGRIAFCTLDQYGMPHAHYLHKYLSNGQGGFTCESIEFFAGWYEPRVNINGQYYATGHLYTVQSTGDFNGDGRSEMLLVYSDQYWRYQTVAAPFNSLILWKFNGQSIDMTNPQINMISNDRVHAQGDYNGDGLQDLLVGEADQYGLFKDDMSVPTDQMKVCINNGNGSFSSNEIHATYQHFYFSGTYIDIPTFSVNLKIVSQGDFNGDGLSDFCIAQADAEGRVLNPTVYSFTHYATGDGMFRPGYSPLEPGVGYGPRAHGDFNGDGKSDFLLADIDGGTGMLDPNDFYIHYSKPVIPNLLTSVSNSRGDETHIVYAPSTHYEQEQNPRPPFTVQTVSSITVEDGMGNEYLTTFDYKDALFDFEDRDFRGFKYAKKINPDGTTEKTGFLQGDFNKGRPFTTELRECDDDLETSLLNKTENTWLDQATGDEAKFVYLDEKRNQLWEGGTHNIETVEQYTYSDYVTDHENAHGGIKTLITSVVPGELGETATTTKDYENKGESGGWVWRMTRERLSGSTSGHKRTTKYEYETGTGNLVSKTFCLDLGNETGPTLTYEYDAYGNLIREYDARNKMTETIYDEATETYPVEIHYPQTGVEPNLIDHIVYKQYDYKFGTIDIETDENGNQTDYNYDEFGRLSDVSTYTPQPEHQLAAQTSYAYSFYVDAAHPNCTATSVKETDATTINHYEYFDGLGRSLSSVSLGASGQTTRTLNAYDEMGRIWKVTGPFFNPGTSVDYVSAPPEGNHPITETIYDKRGRPEEINNNDTVYEWNTTSFDYVGLSTTITDPDGKQKTERKDYLGRLVQVVEYNNAEQYTTTYAYNVAGDLLSVTDHLGTLTTMTYDNLGRKTSMSDPDMGNWTYQYDANGNVVSQTDANNIHTITFFYDEFNRVLTKTYSTGDSTVTHVYDNLSITNGRCRLASVTNTNATTVYNEYDAMGRARLITKTISGDSARATRYDYDLSGKLTHIGYPGTTGQPDGFQVYYTYYPGTGLLHTVTGSDMVEYANFSNYEPTGKIGAMDYGNGTSTSYAYDPKSTRLTGITTHDPSGLPENDIQRRTYNYSPAGDITGITDSLGNIAYTYDYDGLHRLSWEKTNGAFTATYNYNAIGNITSKTMGTDTFTYAYHATKIHAVSQVTKNNGTPNVFSYDSNGNMTLGWDLSGTPVYRRFTYNADNMPQMIAKSGSGVITYFAYDGQGSRVKKTVSGSGTTYYIGDHFEKINGNEVIYIFAGDIRIARKQGTTTNYFHKDHLGSSTAMTDVSGIKVETSVYWPYGYMKSHWGSDVTGYKFTDQELDSSTGLYDYGARMYDPVIGRFVTADTIVQNFSDPQTLNRYSYCRNNPLIYVDPNGHSFFGIEFLIGAVIGAIASGAQSDWNPQAMLVGAAIGGISAGIGAEVSSVVTKELAASIVGTTQAQYVANGGLFWMADIGGAVAGGAAGGATSGGLFAAYYGENIGQGIIEGGGYGAMAALGTSTAKNIPSSFQIKKTISNAHFSTEVTDTISLHPATELLVKTISAATVGGVSTGIFSELIGENFSEGFMGGAIKSSGTYLGGYLIDNFNKLSRNNRQPQYALSVDNKNAGTNITVDLDKHNMILKGSNVKVGPNGELHIELDLEQRK